MSTILKSLKKLEQEKEAKEYLVQGTQYAGPGAVAAAGRASRGMRSPWIRRSLVVLLIVGLGASSFYFYRQSRHSTSPEPENAAASRPPVKQVAKAKIEDPSRHNPPQANPRPAAKEREHSPRPVRPPVRKFEADPSPDLSASTPKGNPAPTTGLPPQRPSSAAQPIRSREPAPIPALRDSQPQKIPQRRLPAETGQKRIPAATVPANRQGAATQVRNPDRSVPAQETSRLDAYDDLRPLTDGRLQIQAIVWSENREDRMAVINTQIVYEGDDVAGFAVVAVRPDDVVVRGEGGGMYRVLFGHP